MYVVASNGKLVGGTRTRHSPAPHDSGTIPTTVTPSRMQTSEVPKHTLAIIPLVSAVALSLVTKMS